MLSNTQLAVVQFECARSKPLAARNFWRWLSALALGALLQACGGGKDDDNGKQQATQSSPIAITSDDKYLWSVNPDNDSVSVFEVEKDRNIRLAEVPVGDEPRCVAITPDDEKVYVTNAVSGSVSVIDAAKRAVVKTIPVGTEPFGCALTPDGKKLYVANLSSNDVSVINTSADHVVKTISGVGEKPRAIAIADLGNETKVYVTQLLAQLRDDGRGVAEKEGRDDGKEGRVTVIAANKDKVIGSVRLTPFNTGFKSNGSTLDRVVFNAQDPATQIETQCFPNLLESIVIKGERAYLANTCASPNGPFRFNVNVQGTLAVIDINSDTEIAAEALNMNKGVQFEPPGKRLFITNPVALAFKHAAAFEGFVVSAATDRLVRLVLEDNKPSINAPKASGDAGAITRIEVGVDPIGAARNSNPQGIAINSTDTRAYMMNFITRDVSVVDIAGNDPTTYKEIARMLSADLPSAGTLAAIVHRGNELFNTAIGPEGTDENAKAPAGRMSDFGWGTCYSCHPRGLTDGITWMFPDGPRQTVSMESTFAHPQPLNALLNQNGAPLLPSSHQRALNWSAVRDEVQDFELNIRAVSGGQGLIALPGAQGRGAQDKCVFNLRFAPSADCPAQREAEADDNTGRDPDLDALAAYIAFGVRAPIAPAQAAADPEVVAGRALFQTANCQGCHGGVNWTASRIDFTPPPQETEVNAGQLQRFLCASGTFDANAFNELKAGAGAQATIVGANGALGFNIPSLISVFASAPYLHSGGAQTLDAVMENVTHRSLGTAGVDTLSNAADRKALVAFLKSIDLSTPTFDLPANAAPC